jgi:hypothetical protein
MSEQLITIDEAGRMESLQFKGGAGAVDLRELGNVSIERTTEILWDETHQAWFIRILTGKLKGHTVKHSTVISFGGEPDPAEFGAIPLANSQRFSVLRPVLFPEYDDAVRYEIAFVQFLRTLNMGLV